MAHKKRNNFIKKKGKWYYRLILWNGIRQSEWTIPMRTDNKDLANRLANKYIKPIVSDIRAGNTQKFQLKELLPWLNDEGKVEYIQKTLKDIVVDYFDYRSAMVKPSTLKRDKSALNQLMEFVGYTKPVEELSYKDIEGNVGLIQHLKNKNCTNVGINTTLTHIGIFLNWLYEKEKIISEPIKFKKLKKGNKLYHYFNEGETNQIYNYIDDNTAKKNYQFYKRCFHFYSQTGMRPTEPFIGELVGNYYIIDAQDRKNGIPMQMQLNEELKAMLMEMQSFRDTKLHCKDANARVVDMLERAVMNIVRALELTGKRLTLYSFRHSYAIKRITMLNGNVFDVMREMGHSNVQTTMEYLRFPLERRLDDFPSLRDYILNHKNIGENTIRANNLRANIYSNIPNLLGSSDA